MNSEGMPVEWTEGAIAHMARHGVTVAEATEALNDPDRAWIEPDPKSHAGNGIRVIGYSPSHGRLLTLILRKYTGSVRLYGVNGWPANRTDQTRYEQES